MGACEAGADFSFFLFEEGKGSDLSETTGGDGEGEKGEWKLHIEIIDFDSNSRSDGCGSLGRLDIDNIGNESR